MRPTLPALLACLVVLVAAAAPAQAQHLWWQPDGATPATCAYGRITVLATHVHTYYCGVNWHPGEPAGGYCGIQDNGPQDNGPPGTDADQRRTIFSIWDTSDALHPTATAMDPRTITDRFGGEGTGGHTHMVLPWKLGQPFQFFVRKTPAKGKPGATDACYYFVDPASDKWVFEAVIQSPNGGHASVGTIAGGMNAFFLANGSAANLDPVFAAIKPKFGDPAWGAKGTKLPPVKATAVPPEVVKQLGRLPGPPTAAGATTRP